jgi:hypothetical protein
MPLFSAILGLTVAGIAAIAASRIAASAERRPAAAFGLCAFFIAALAYAGVLQTLILYVHPSGPLAAAVGPEAVYTALAGIAALSAVLLGTTLILAWTRLTRTAAHPAGRFRTSGFALLFSAAITILAAPFLIQNQLTIERSVAANIAEIEAFKQSYTNGLEKLSRIGALSRIEVGDDAVTHYIGGPLYKIGDKGLAEYARAAMIYHTQVLGNEPMPVVLRDSTTETEIGTFRVDNVYVVHTDVVQSETAEPAPKIR